MQRLTPHNNALRTKRKLRGMILRNGCKPRKTRLAAMTLIELMIVVAVLSILASIAYPSYQSYVLKSYRSKALSDMVKLQLELEANYNNGYSWNSLISGGSCNQCETPTTRYVFSIASQAGKAYVIKAQAQSGSGQTKDRCLTDESVDYMTLDSSNTSYPSACWN